MTPHVILCFLHQKTLRKHIDLITGRYQLLNRNSISLETSYNYSLFTFQRAGQLLDLTKLFWA